MIVKEKSDQERDEMKYLIYQLKVTISLKSRNKVFGGYRTNRQVERWKNNMLLLSFDGRLATRLL